VSRELPLDCVSPDAETCLYLERICADFCWLVDHGRADQTHHLFTPDVRYTAQGRESSGLQEVMRRMSQRAARRDYVTRHVASGFRFHQLGPDEVEGQCVMVIYRDSSAVALVADVHDLFRREGDGPWRLARRHVTSVLPDSGAAAENAN
jgi:hypothetical protein